MAAGISKRWLLAIFGIVFLNGLILPMIAKPASSKAATRSCGVIVRKSDGDFYKSRVSIVQGSVGCGEARQFLWRAFNFQFDTKVGAWECSVLNFGDGKIHNQKCIRETEGERAVIRSSHPRYCQKCTAIEK